MVFYLGWAQGFPRKNSHVHYFRIICLLLSQEQPIRSANKKLLYFGLGPDEYTRISECESAKDIWDALQVAHEGTNQVKQSRIELLMRKYELFEMGDCETIMDTYTRFTHIAKELKSLGKTFTTEELLRKILRFLPRSWEAKVTAIQEAKDLKTLSLDELIGNLQPMS